MIFEQKNIRRLKSSYMFYQEFRTYLEKKTNFHSLSILSTLFEYQQMK